MAVLNCATGVAARPAVAVPSHNISSLSHSRSYFSGSTGAMPLQHASRMQLKSGRAAVVEVKSFKFMKKLGLKKPEFLPDFGKDKRQAMLDKFFTSTDKFTLDELLAENAQIVEQGPKARTYNKTEWINLLCNHVVPAVPDYKWNHSTDAAKDPEGYCVVKVQAKGSHTGKPFRIPGSELPKVEPKQKTFSLPKNTLKVKVEDGLIHEIQVLPEKGTGFLGIYEAIGGKVPVA